MQKLIRKNPPAKWTSSQQISLYVRIEGGGAFQALSTFGKMALSCVCVYIFWLFMVSSKFPLAAKKLMAPSYELKSELIFHMKYWKAERKVFTRSFTDMLKSISICKNWICFLLAFDKREDAYINRLNWMFKRNGWGQNLPVQ